MNLLIIDDDQNVRSSIVKFLQLKGYHVQGASSAHDAQDLLNKNSYDAILLDLRMPEMDGLEFLEWLKKESFLIPIIMISAHGELEDAVQAMKLGARDYLTKPFNPEELLLRINRLNDEIQLKKNLDTQKAANTLVSGSHCFWGSDPVVEKLRNDLGRAALTDATILLLGESGTGKEVTARWVHAMSNRNQQPFLPVNLGSLTESLVESELFGHEKGAFTGAVERKPGIFEAAQGGTVFLDEVGELPQQIQPKLLRVLQEGMVKRLGNPREFPVDVRVIAATNKNLWAMVQNGSFREDLFYRLNIIPFTLPQLQNRKQDIPGFVELLLKKISGRIGKKNLSLAPGAIELLMNYNFPGNIRELENLLERWAILEPDTVIQLEAVRTSLQSQSLTSQESPENPELTLNLKAQEQKTIVQALETFGGNRTRAAERLGISRKTLITKIAEYGLRTGTGGK